MCNLYSITTGQQTILQASRAMIDRTGNLPPLPIIYAAPLAPIAPELASTTSYAG